MNITTTVPASVLAVLAMGSPAFGMIFNDADPVIAQYRERQEQILAKLQTIDAVSKQEGRELTSDENTEIDNGTAEYDRLDEEIERRESIQARVTKLGTGQGRKSEPEPINQVDVPARTQNSAPQARRPANPNPQFDMRTGGFRGFGDFAFAVKNASTKGGQVDERLKIRAGTASTISTEGVGADGGFAVPPDFRSEIMSKVFGQESLLSRATQIPVAGNSLTIPVDMTTPWQSTGGIQAFWDGETAAATQSKVAFENQNIRLSKIRALVPVSEELLEDAVGLGAYVTLKTPAIIDFRISFAMTWGNGVGKPLGFMNSPALVTQAAVGGQTADTINATNIVQMFSCLPASSVSTAVWLVHPGAWAQLPLMSIGQMPVYLPPSGLESAPFGLLMGRPVIPHQVCSSIGDLGDIMLVDMSEYIVPIKAGGLRSDTSIHLWFDQDLTAFKFTLRLGGQPWWSSSTSARAGTFAQSPFITLAAR